MFSCLAFRPELSFRGELPASIDGDWENVNCGMCPGMLVATPGTLCYNAVVTVETNLGPLSPGAKAVFSLLGALLMSAALLVGLPIFLGIKAHLYIYHSTPFDDPLRLFKAIGVLLVVVVTSSVALSGLVGRFLQPRIRNLRERVAVSDPGSTSRVSQAPPPNEPRLSARQPERRGYPGLDTNSEKVRVLEQLLGEEQDENIRVTLQSALAQQLAEAEHKGNSPPNVTR
ncbi:MAG: hypothetical protein HY318_03120 [Armatimonadetes bacterium]|nr:hypothetical protein [Armatimonadota bacterium]